MGRHKKNWQVDQTTEYVTVCPGSPPICTVTALDFKPIHALSNRQVSTLLTAIKRYLDTINEWVIESSKRDTGDMVAAARCLKLAPELEAAKENLEEEQKRIGLTFYL